MRNWATVQQYYDFVNENDLKPFDGVEWYPFIEGLASGGSFDDALQVSKYVIAISPNNQEYLENLCYVWDRAAKNTGISEQISNSKIILGCK